MGLRRIQLERQPNGSPIRIPLQLTEGRIDQQVQRWMEIASRSAPEASDAVTGFRSYHGGEWTVRVLEACMQELRDPAMELDLPCEREGLVPLFLDQQERQRRITDADVGFPRDRSVLPL